MRIDPQVAKLLDPRNLMLKFTILRRLVTQRYPAG